MKNRGTQVGVAVMLTAVLVLALALAGCKSKSEPAAAPPAEVKATAPAAAAVQQTICPVMGKAIDKNIFTEYQGKKVYFCCSNCKKKFEEAPKKYIGKLPQLQ